MQYSVGVEYALHCLTYLIDLPSGSSISIKDLATYQGVSETYLSKSFTKLAKAGIIRSMPGVKGGYQLARGPEHISFWDVVEAIEGSTPIFQCQEVRQNCVLLQGEEMPDYIRCAPCAIKVVMTDAEEQMRQYLKGKSLAWLQKELNEKIPRERQEATSRWFQQAIIRR
ncbi:Rrf2 family transcriptional regulator [Alicyclobacillus sp. SO9]|uniref:RrF2 family transcriptional regulator n=1 Tax=Alicyclobacillus sp. SO9 TaxID=2665646 RepID=UPI0018E78DE0|nr:Rrf2 family transcriptional regulator [Alicyclobacillus sp. SO9]QQE77214.1 Rrf2 family transcriptional regulator [Alicyclobacillus sp. SO9]